jgi:DNA polymerase-1
MAVAWILARQERHGFLFDVKAAGELYKKLAKRRIELEAELAKVFKPFYMAGAYRVPKKTVRTQVEELGREPEGADLHGRRARPASSPATSSARWTPRRALRTKR